MKDIIILIVDLISAIFTLLKPGGVKALVAENVALKQQLIVATRKNKRCPPLTTYDRLFFGLTANIISPKRLNKIAINLKPATILNFHKKILQKKYHELFSSKIKNKPGRKPLAPEIIKLILEMHKQNPSSFGYGRIAMQVELSFDIKISRFAVGRIIRKYKHKLPPSTDGPSWLTFLGHMKDSLWSVDLFRCESINLKSHYVMVVMDQYTRRIVGFAVNKGDCTGADVCRMFYSITKGKDLPKYLSSDNDPLFKFNRWEANLRLLDIDEIKTVPYTPVSHPFVERLIGTVRREYLDHTLFFNERDLQNKLNDFQEYYNETRGHSSLASKTPKMVNRDQETKPNCTKLPPYTWKSYCRGLYKLPVPIRN